MPLEVAMERCLLFSFFLFGGAVPALAAEKDVEDSRDVSAVVSEATVGKVSAPQKSQGNDGYQFSFQTGFSLNAPSAAIGLEGGVRLGESFSLLAKAEWNPWVNTQDLNSSFNTGVLNVGLGGEYRFFDDRCSTALFAGVSSLLFDTALDAAGSTGFFVEIQTLSIRWALADAWALRLAPATIHLIMPVLTGIPLMSFQYRQTLAIDWTI